MKTDSNSVVTDDVQLLERDTSKESHPSTSPKADPTKSAEKENALVRWVRVNPRYRLVTMLTVLASLSGATLGLAYFCWFVWLIPIWKWGFEPPTWRGILSVCGAFYVVLGPVAPFGFGSSLLGSLLNLFTEERERRVKASLDKLDASKSLTEEALAENDRSGLISLVRYSRLQLESYYTIGLGQSQRSFRYSILAMWIGFLIISAGILLSILPVRDAAVPASNMQTLTIASGAVVELISALFLWIYRSSIGQLTYFYNRQMYLHSVLVGARIAESMKDSDQTKQLIVQRILESHGQAQPSLPSLFRGRAHSSSKADAPAAA